MLVIKYNLLEEEQAGKKKPRRRQKIYVEAITGNKFNSRIIQGVPKENMQWNLSAVVVNLMEEQL